MHLRRLCLSQGKVDCAQEVMVREGGHIKDFDFVREDEGRDLQGRIEEEDCSQRQVMLETGRDVPPGIPSERGIVGLMMTECLVSVKRAWE